MISGNIVITNNYEVKISNTGVDKSDKFLPPSDYSSSSENQQISGNVSVEIGIRLKKIKTGNVVYFRIYKNKSTKEPVAGVTVYISETLNRNNSNEYGFYSLTAPVEFIYCIFHSLG